MTCTHRVLVAVVLLLVSHGILVADAIRQPFENIPPEYLHGGQMVAGHTGQGYFADGVQQYLALPVQQFPVNQGTLAFWVKPQWEPSDTTARVLLDALGTPSYYDRWIFHLQTNGQFRFLLEHSQQAGESQIIDIPNPFQKDIWTHVAVTWENVNSGLSDSSADVYIDGVLIEQTANNESIVQQPPQQITVGGFIYDTFASASAVIDDLLLADMPMTSGQIVQEAGRAVTSPAEGAAAPPIITIHSASTAPVIDGNVNEAVWASAMHVEGLRYSMNELAPDMVGYIDPDSPEIYLTYDNDTLYVGWQAAISSTTKTACAATEHDGPVWQDESIEIHIDAANTGANNHQFIINMNGVVYDARDGQSSWNYTGQCRASHTTDLWQGEIAIPFADLLPGTTLPPTQVKANLGYTRHYANDERVENLMWCNFIGSYAQPDKFGTFRLQENAAVMALRMPLEPSVGMHEIMWTVTEAGGSGTYTLDAIRYQDQALAAVSSARITTPQGVEKTLNIPISLTEKGAYTFLSIVKDAAGTVVYRRSIPVKARDPIEIVSVEPLYLFGRCEVTLDATRMPDPGQLTGMIKVIDKSNDEIKSTLAVDNLATVKMYTVDISSCTPGEYRIAVELADAEQTPYQLSESLTVPPQPDYVGSTLGISDTVPPPFSPLEVSGTTVRCWGREYIFTDMAIPSQIVSQGEQMLSGPAVYRVVAGGEAVVLPAGKVRVISQSDTVVTLTSRHVTEDIILNLYTTVEYDGMVKVDATFTPSSSQSIDSLTFEIPLKDSHARYLQFLNGNIDIADPIAVGSDGWSHREVFMPHIWLADDERGLAWFCESDQGWVPYDRPDTLVIAHDDDTVLLTCNIIKRHTISKPFEMTFGLMASPIRPVSPQSRLWNAMLWAWVGYASTAQVPPGEHTYNIMPSNLAAIKAQNIDLFQMHTYWSLHFGSNTPLDPTDFGRFINDAHAAGLKVLPYFSPCVIHGLYAPEVEYFGKLWTREPYKVTPVGTSRGTRKELDYVWLSGNAPEYDSFLTESIVKLIQEYGIDGVYYDGGAPIADKNMRVGSGYRPEEGEPIIASGASKSVGANLYEFDAEKMQQVAGGYEDVRWTYPMFKPRQTFKRIYTATKAINPHFIVLWHHSQFWCAPLGGFADIGFVTEGWNAHTKRFPTKPEIRCEAMGVQRGLPYAYMSYETELPDGSVAVKTTEWLAAALVHGANLFPVYEFWLLQMRSHHLIPQYLRVLKEYGTDKAKWIPYYDNGGYIVNSPEQIQVSLYLHNSNGVLLAVSRLWDQVTGDPPDKQVDIELNLQALRLDGGVPPTAHDPIRNQDYTMIDGVISNIPVNFREPVLIHVKRQERPADSVGISYQE